MTSIFIDDDEEYEITNFIEDQSINFIYDVSDTVGNQNIQQTNNIIFNYCEDNNLVNVKEIFNKNIHLNVKDIYGRTPILVAIENNFMNLIDFFISNGSNILDSDNDGDNGLMLAVIYDNLTLLNIYYLFVKQTI